MKKIASALLFINLLFLFTDIGYVLNYNNIRNVIMAPIFPTGNYFIIWELVIIIALSIDLYGTGEAKLARIHSFLRTCVVICSPILFLFTFVALGVSDFLNNPRFTSLNPNTEGGIATIYYIICIAGLLNTAFLFSYFLRSPLQKRVS
jgi:hypothetical protein